MESTEDSDHPKVVNLFPLIKRSREADCPETSAGNSDELEDLTRAVRNLLEDAQPLEEHEAASYRLSGAPAFADATSSRSPHATLSSIQQCKAERGDGSAQAFDSAGSMRGVHRFDWLWSCAILSWGLALGCLYALQHWPMSHNLSSAMHWTLLLVLLTNAIGFAVASESKS